MAILEESELEIKQLQMVHRPVSKNLDGPEKYQSLTSDGRELTVLGPKPLLDKNTNHFWIERTLSSESSLALNLLLSTIFKYNVQNTTKDR